MATELGLVRIHCDVGRIFSREGMALTIIAMLEGDVFYEATLSSPFCLMLVLLLSLLVVIQSNRFCHPVWSLQTTS